jgi:Tfp pilus assembly protein PilX
MKTILCTLRNESGSTLVVGILTLVILSLLGVAATTTSRIEVEIAGNDKAVKQAFYASELGLTYGETVVQDTLNRLDLNDGNPGHYDRGDQPVWYDLKWDITDSTEVPADIKNLKGYEKMDTPRYTVEELERKRGGESLIPGITRVYLFTVSGHGAGGSTASEAVVRSTYAKRYN